MKHYFTADIIKLAILGWLFMSPHAALSATPIEKVWVDTDITIGKFGKDVDDGIALIMALRSPGLHIVGIGVVTEIEYGYGIAEQLLKWYSNGEEIPIYKGGLQGRGSGHCK